MNKRFEYNLAFAKSIAITGTCKKRNYGCVISDANGTFISAGKTHSLIKCKTCKRKYMPKGKGYDKCPSIHAEQEALINSKIPQGSIAFLACFDMKTCREVRSPAPCPTCAKLLKEAGVVKVITKAGEIAL